MEAFVCNPMNLEYRYQFKCSPLGTAVYREAADPTLVVFQGTYLLFASMSGGFWYSDDLHTWAYRATPELPVYDYAPDVHVMRDGVVFTASNRDHPCGIYFSRDPLAEPFQKVSTPLKFWDPAIFQDDDGRVYLYWGCDTRQPIWGVELDAKTMTPLGKKKALLRGNETRHGWERVGENNKLAPPKNMGERLVRLALGTRPCMEGAFMTKHEGKYYLQYAAPGTEHNVYSDGVYVGQHPLGPFAYQVHNPFSSKPGGFITAAGHGSTFRDKEGRWWHISTMRISDNDNYERRLGLFPCGFDDDGILYCNQNFADYPFDLYATEDRMTAMPRDMLLSYGARVAVSSFQEGFEGAKAADETIRTHWAAQNGDRDPWLMMDLGEEKQVRHIQLNFADHQLPLPPLRKRDMVKENIGHRAITLDPQHTAYLLESSRDGAVWTVLRDNTGAHTDFTHDLITLPEPRSIRYIRVREIRVAMSGVAAISGLRVFGTGNGEKPAAVRQVKVRMAGPLNALLTWPAAAGAQGYNVRYGIAPDKLYASWQVIGRTSLDLSTIRAGCDYFAAIDSYNENGVTPGIPIKIVPAGGQHP